MGFDTDESLNPVHAEHNCEKEKHADASYRKGGLVKNALLLTWEHGWGGLMQGVWIAACIPKVCIGAYYFWQSYSWVNQLDSTIQFWLFRDRPEKDWQCLQESIGDDVCTILPPPGFSTDKHPHGSAGAASPQDFHTWRTDCTLLPSYVQVLQ